MAEQRIGQVIVGRAEVRVVEDVEELSPETKPDLFREMKLALECDIRLGGSEAAKNVAPEIALRARRRRSEGRRIEDFAAGILRPKELKRDS